MELVTLIHALLSNMLGKKLEQVAKLEKLDMCILCM